MTRPTPKNEERQFEIDELFFSTTDSRGIIQDGNGVFARVSGYTITELLHKPHNIIRHPDMPKAVFKLLWDTIQNKQMIAAYVKNMAIDGRYYWVLAAVFPIGDQYLSIRLKPTSKIFEAAQNIYAEALQVEKDKDMESSLSYIVDAIKNAGFESYEQFMTTALLTELQSREEALSLLHKKVDTVSDASSSINTTIRKVKNIAQDTADSFAKLFSSLKQFEDASNLFQNKTNQLLDAFFKFQVLSLNMRVFAAQIGQDGASLGVVSDNFQSLMNRLEEHFKTFSEDTLKIKGSLAKASLEIGALKIQSDMVDFFVRESLTKIMSDNSLIKEAFTQLEGNAGLFTDLSRQYTQKVSGLLSEISEQVKDFVFSNKEIKKFVNGIELISQIGAVEAARLNEERRSSFSQYPQQMKEFSLQLRNNAQEIGSAIISLENTVKESEYHLREATSGLKNIFEITLQLKNSDH